MEKTMDTHKTVSCALATSLLEEAAHGEGERGLPRQESPVASLGECLFERESVSFLGGPLNKVEENGPALDEGYPVERSFAEIHQADRIDRICAAAVFGLLAFVLAASVLTYRSLEIMMECFHGNEWIRVLLAVNQALVVVNAMLLIWRIVLVRRYRPVPVCRDVELPEVTVIVPAYNEGESVLETLRTIACSRYPAEKLHIVGVDDGSMDDTWSWMKKAADELGDRVEIVHCPVNRGKRHALHEGFLLSKGEVIVTIDSDSVVPPDTLRRLVSAFRQDPKVGAVAGNVCIWNRKQGLIPRMLDVSFTYSFDFIRASQSAVHTVMCTPGALSAYRREIVLNVLPQWIGQKFLGRPANIGEDRAMTNLILRSGYHVLYQKDAVVYTKVPTTYNKLWKMFLRWARSNLRETLVMCGFVFRKFRSTPMAGARINFMAHSLNLFLVQVLRIETVACLFASPIVFGTHLILGTMLVSCVPLVVYTLRYRNGNGLWAIFYGLFWIFALWWITPYAMVTPHKTRWLTRTFESPNPFPVPPFGGPKPRLGDPKPEKVA